MRFVYVHTHICTLPSNVQLFHAIIAPSARDVASASATIGPVDPNTGSVQIFVTGVSGKTLTVQIDPIEETVFTLKRKILAKEPVPVAVQKVRHVFTPL